MGKSSLSVYISSFLHPVARMDYHTIQEIRGYNRPAPVVHNVMKSTYTLLGEKQGLDVSLSGGSL